MIHKWLEEWHDTVLFFGAILGLVAVFLGYWKGEYQNRYAEQILQDFLSAITVKGEITSEEYERLIRSLDAINPEYNTELSCFVYEPEPIYALIPEEELILYYMDRNVKNEVEFCKYDPVIAEPFPESLCLQKESNADIMASAHNKLPLPEDESVWKIEAHEPIQWVYKGENLITMCHIVSEEGEYYAEAEPVKAESTGIVYLRLQIGGEEYEIAVQAYCYPRIVVCENGHEVVNSEQILARSNTIRKEVCPYCEILPEKISCKTELVRKETGSILTEQDVWITVSYMNGTTEIVTPDSTEWQDSYDENYCGFQEVIVSYRGKEDKFFVISENAGCRQCNEACNERNYQDYICFPYCTKCLSETELFSGKVYEGEQIISSGELIDYLDANGKKSFQQGDFIRIYLTKKKRYVSMVQGKVIQDGQNEEEK